MARPHDEPVSPTRGPLRLALAIAGFTAVALAFVGVFVPGLPTTPFLLLAGICLKKSFPKAARRVLGATVFRPYRPYLDGEKPIPLRAKWTATVAMWGMIAISLGILHHGGALNILLGTLIVASGVVGTWVLWAVIDRRRRAAQDIKAGCSPPHHS